MAMQYLLTWKQPVIHQAVAAFQERNATPGPALTSVALSIMVSLSCEVPLDGFPGQSDLRKNVALLTWASV